MDVNRKTVRISVHVSHGKENVRVPSKCEGTSTVIAPAVTVLPTLDGTRGRVCRQKVVCTMITHMCHDRGSQGQQGMKGHQYTHECRWYRSATTAMPTLPCAHAVVWLQMGRLSM